jgi:glycosidase
MKKTKTLVFLFLALTLVLSACQPDSTTSTTAIVTSDPDPTNGSLSEDLAEPGSDDFGWWNEVVFYEIFVRSFKDSDGDGIGDFQGIISMLDYLNDGDPETTDDLGIGGIWLMPIMPSPSYHGYDVTNYQSVNPDYGTMADFKELLDECHQRGIRVVIDFVINHTSNEHPWFVQSQDPNSSFRDWYVWEDKNPAKPGPWGQNAWYEKDDAWYYAPFWSGMPDLNYNHPMVNKAIYNATKFWLDMGVDGFRVDAARYLFEDGVSQQDTKSSIAWFQDWRDYYLSINPEAYTVGEVWTDTQVIAKYDQPTKGMQNYFMFDLATDILGSVYSPDPSRIMKSYLDTLEYFPSQQFATFLTNHDQQRLASYFSDRLMQQKMAAFVYLTGPGVPYVYYGEEIGMLGGKPDELIRKPMQWSAEENAGFSTGKPWQEMTEGWEEKNVELASLDSDSLLNWYRGLINLRNQYPELQKGDYYPLISSCRRVYAVIRLLDGEAVLTIANLGVQEAENCTISTEAIPLNGTMTVESLWGDLPFEEIYFDGKLDETLIAPLLEGGATFILKLSN